MPNNKLPEGNGMKGGNHDAVTGVGNTAGGPTGSIGNFNGADNDGGIGTPGPADAGNLQSTGGQPGGTPAQGDSQRSRGGAQGGTDQTPQAADGQGNRQSAYEHVNQDDEADRLRGTPDDRPLAARQESSDEVGTARPSKN